jgi:hypothetical protein
MQDKKQLPKRETGNWSGKQGKKPEKDSKQESYLGQREYTDVPKGGPENR